MKANNRLVYFAYYRDTPLATGSSAQVWFMDPDMAYAFPTDNGLTLLACLPHKDRLEEFKAGPEEAMARIYEALPDAPRIDPAKRESKVLGKLDISNERRRPSYSGVAFVGDAALTSDPLWGVGCGWALQSAEWLADAVDPALRGKVEMESALKAYSRRHRRALRMHDLLCTNYSSGRRFNPAEKMFFRAAARDDEIAGRFALFGERWIKPQQLLTPGTIGRALLVNLSPNRRPLGLRKQPAEAR